MKTIKITITTQEGEVLDTQSYNIDDSTVRIGIRQLKKGEPEALDEEEALSIGALQEPEPTVRLESEHL
jgi:hypothetical protein